jgi:hypothetical protein
VTAPHLIAGVDPGLSGAIALYDSDAGDPFTQFTIFDMPTLEITVNRKKRRRIDLYAMARLVDLYAKDIALVVIEAVGPSPRDSKAGAFTFGATYGIARMAFASHFTPEHPATPAVWKKALGLTGDKDMSRALASRMFPAASHLWARKCDDGRAESALLAWYGAKLKERGQI